MIYAYIKNQLIKIDNNNEHHISDAIWIDLVDPHRKEEKLVEHLLNIDIPTKKERQEIEPSSRLYEENSNLFMTATMLADSQFPELNTDAVTFVLSENRLITIRYIEPQTFKLFISHLSRSKKKTYDAKRIFTSLLEITIDRLADILEYISHEFDQISFSIFRDSDQQMEKMDYQKVLMQIGTHGDLSSRVRESLVSFTRLISFISQSLELEEDEYFRSILNVFRKDIKALNDYESFISTKINFLLEATLGMVNIEQNKIIKIFSIVTVIFLPPTLIASIYGMNFTLMPELNTRYGYPIVIVFMILSAIFPYLYFKMKQWL